jgi:hypothetical protein
MLPLAVSAVQQVVRRDPGAVGIPTTHPERMPNNIVKTQQWMPSQLVTTAVTTLCAVGAPDWLKEVSR